MAIKDSWHNPERDSRLRMEEAAKRSFGTKSEKALHANDEPKVKGYKLRGKLYDKIKVSVRTMDIIIAIVVVLLLAAIIVGIATGNRA